MFQTVAGVTVVLLLASSTAHADYQLEFQLISYNNSLGMLNVGACCDLEIGGVCRVDLDTCDTSFLITLTNLNTNQAFTQQDVLTADYDDTDYIDFPSCGQIPSDIMTINNPLVFTVSASQWAAGDVFCHVHSRKSGSDITSGATSPHVVFNVMNTLRLRVLARDADPFFLYLDIATILFDIVRPSAPDAAFVATQGFGGNGVSFQLRHRVICTDGTCGSDCTQTSGCVSFPGACADCTPNPCQNGGTCNMDGTSGYTCDCLPDYTGFNCEQPVVQDPCTSNPCQNQGSCMGVSGNDYTCTCPTGFTGTNCGTDFCNPSRCENQGTCIRRVDGYDCNCLMGYSGTDCEVNVFCLSNPCQNDGECSAVMDGYACNCQIGFTGMNCENDVCEPNPCLNGGTCEGVNDDIGYVCTCPMEYMGNNCENLNPCIPNPCQNQGTCINMEGSVNCLCTLEWDGENCSIPRNLSCDPNPCLNGGTCMMSEDSVMCLCSSNFTGVRCGLRFQDCTDLGLFNCFDVAGCYAASERCDRISQCADGSDEFLCPGIINIVAVAVGASVGGFALICLIVIAVIAVACFAVGSAMGNSNMMTTTVVAGTISNETVVPMKMTSASDLAPKEMDAAITSKQPILPPRAAYPSYPGSTGY